MILSEPPARHPFTPLKVVLLSGLSDPSTCALSAAQTRFLASLAAPEESKIYWNFPYLPSPGARRDPPLWLASLRNLRQFLQASRPAYRAHWHALAASAESLVVITGSCGLEIFNHCLEAGDPVGHLFALGPVARARPAVPHTLVQGTRDPFSRVFFRKCDVELPGVGHMTYLGDSRVQRLVNDYLCSSTFPSAAPASISRDAG
jgi:hypothetical protein